MEREDPDAGRHTVARGGRTSRVVRSLLVLVGIASLTPFCTGSVSQAARPRRLSAADAAVVRRFGGLTTHITIAQFDKRKLQVRAERSAAGPSPTTSVGEESLGQLIEEIATESEADRRGIRVGRRPVAKAFREIKSKRFSSTAAFDRYLKALDLTEAEARHRVRVQLLFAGIEKEILKGASGLHRAAVLGRFTTRFLRRWRMRTVCLASLATDRCSNGPPLGGAAASGSGRSRRPRGPRRRRRRLRRGGCPCGASRSPSSAARP
jgi:hypothetical protein